MSLTAEPCSSAPMNLARERCLPIIRPSWFTPSTRTTRMSLASSHASISLCSTSHPHRVLQARAGDGGEEVEWTDGEHLARERTLAERGGAGEEVAQLERRAVD